MNRDLFESWLKNFKRFDASTINARISNCKRIEKYYGDLDEIYNEDKFITLLEELTYNTTDRKFGAKPKHKIPIEGDIYNVTHTLKVALKLYVEYRENKIIEELKTIEDINPEKHDGSYELVRETIKSLSTIPNDMVDINDLDLLYAMVVGTWRMGIDVKQQKIKESNLDNNEKERLLSILEKVKEKAINHYYDNIKLKGQNSGWSIGMFGTGFQTFASKSDKESARRFISLCINLVDMNDDEAIFEKVELAIKKGIRGMQSAAVSVMLHCLKPYTFPIMNSAVNSMVPLFEIEGVCLVKPNELGYYIYNVRQLKKFRDEKCKFKNYRAMDLKLSIYSRNNDVEDNENASINDNFNYDIQWKEEVGISKEEWLILLKDDDIFKEEDRELINIIYNNKKYMACAYELAKNMNCTNSSSLNLQVGRLGKRIAKRLKITETKWKEGEENNWWHILFWGTKINGRFWWILRPELKEALDEYKRDDNERENSVEESIIYTKEDFLNEVFISEQQYDDIVILLNRKKNVILQGAPGVGKTFVAKRLAYSIIGVIDDSRIEMVQFHQNYSYEDFVMGYRPVKEGGFELRNGIFYQFCIRAANDPTHDYFFIIDEINRGNLSKIFGELLMLIENDKRGLRFAVPLTYKPDARFYVPQNVYIIGMMNTADRSIALMDYALRRRFCYIEIEPAFNAQSFKRYLSDNGIDDELINKIVEKMNYINNEITTDCNLGKGFRIGHSYFCNPSTDGNWYQSIIQYEIFPLIEEYWYDNEEKVQEYKDYLLG